MNEFEKMMLDHYGVRGYMAWHTYLHLVQEATSIGDLLTPEVRERVVEGAVSTVDCLMDKLDISRDKKV